MVGTPARTAELSAHDSYSTSSDNIAEDGRDVTLAEGLIDGPHHREIAHVIPLALVGESISWRPIKSSI
jgi:hypothetical protein